MENEPVGWWLLVVAFFGCFCGSIGIGLAESDSDTLNNISTNMMMVAVFLAIPLWIRYHWFRVMIVILILYAIAVCGNSGTKGRRSERWR